MLHRPDAEGLIVISQPAHAWVSGQMARSWGNEHFIRPTEEVCLAAEQHDLGFLHWEQFPTLNAATGLPHTFMELPASIHLDIWTAGIRHMLRFGRYPALLVSMHFAGLAKRNPSGRSAEDSLLVNRFLEAQEALQTSLLTSLRNDFYYAPICADEIVRRDQQLVSSWDWMSLLLCMGVREEKTIPEAPSKEGMKSVKMIPLNDQATRVAIHPWPFSSNAVKLICDGRRLLKSYADENEMREGLKAAAPVTLSFELVRE
jgi:hypothetical protein